MQAPKIAALSTGPLPASLVEESANKGIELDILSFIEIVPIESDALTREIINAASRSAVVVFTSSNAVTIVAKQLNQTKPDWKIYCPSGTTRKPVEEHFGKDAIKGVAADALQLATLLVKNENCKEVVFFCGDQRRGELPEYLIKNNIIVNEITVYQTQQKKQILHKTYRAILFYSPSAVESFFSVNTILTETVLFAIGSTTANEIRKYSTNELILSDAPGKEQLVQKMIEYLSR